MTLLGSVEEKTTDVSGDQTPSETPENKEEQKPTDWLSSLPDELKEEPSLKVFKDPAALAKSYVHAQKQIGKDKVVVPDPKLATDEEWSEFYSKIGRPETADDYQLEVEGMDEEFVSAFKQQAHKAGLRPNQVEGLFQWYNEFVGGASEKAEESAKLEKERQLVELKNEWGKAFDTKLQHAKTIYRNYMPEEVQAHMDKMGYNDDPVMVKAFAHLAEKFLSEGERVGNPNGSTVLSPAEAKAKIDEVMANNHHAYWNPDHENHNKAKEEMKQLYELANPSS